MSEGWKTFLDIFNAVGTFVSFGAAILTLSVLKKINKIRGDMLLRAALPDLRTRMTTVNRNLKVAVDRKANTSVMIAELRALAHDLASKVVSQSVTDLAKLHDATATLIETLGTSPRVTPDLLETIEGHVTTVVTLIASAERDQKIWSLSG